MASIILSSIGASAGNMLVPGLGGKLMGAFARKIGHVIDGEIGWSHRADVKDGARLENFKVQDSRYGLSIPLAFGRIRVAGNVIWASDLIETAHQETVGGGKGGIVSDAFTSTRTTYTYSLNCAIALAQGEIGGIQTIWADSKVIYQNGVWKAGLVGSFAFHKGSADQSVDPLLEGWIGAGLTPAYRGVAYIVLEGLQLKTFGNRLPNMTFELLPKDETGAPSWLGQVNPATYHHNFSLRHGGMLPIVLEGGAVSARRLLVGGYQYDGATAAFDVIEYEVSEDVPVELARASSESFACEDICDHSWAMAPDGRYVALGMQDGASGCPYRLALYDSGKGVFGPVLSLSLPTTQVRQLAWIDAQHFVVPDTSGGMAGVRVFARAGLAVMDLGFTAVWGAGSATTRVPVGYTQFVKYGDGLLMFAGDRALKFGAFYGCYLGWSNNAPSIGTPFTVIDTVDQGSGSGPQIMLRETAEGELTLFYMTSIDMQMISFAVNKTSAIITRPWQKLASAAFAASTSNVPLVTGDKVIVVHRAGNETLFRMSEIALNVNSFALVADAVPVGTYVSPSAYVNAVFIDPLKIMVLGMIGFDNQLGLIGTLKRRNTGDTLDTVVALILQKAGYASEDIDVTALAGVDVNGYVVSEQATAAAALAPLQLLLPFDLIERDGKLRAVVHGQGSAVTLGDGEVAATSAAGDDPAPRLTQSRTQELDLPIELAVDYLDAVRDYEVSSQRARRTATKGARSCAKIELPVVCPASHAKQIAEHQLYAAWVERDAYRLVVSRKWIGLEPGDCVTVATVCMRITAVTMKGGLVQIDGVRAVPPDFASSAQAEGRYAGAGLPNLSVVPTTLALMDLPLLRNEDDAAGVYVAASGVEGWTGATLWRAEDGVSFSLLASLTSAATIGIATTVLASRSCDFIDRASSVRVQLLRGTLSSCTDSELMNGANAALCGGEILQFQSATLIGDGLYELSGFLRGRRGTESAAPSHAIGERFVLLNASSLKFISAPLTDRSKLYHFRAVTSGGSIDFAQDLAFAYSLRSLEPFAPVNLRGVRASGTGSDLTVGWMRRARMNAEWVDYIDVPLDEDREAYDVEIMNGAALMRTFSALATNAVTYTAAQQTADWGGSVPATFTIRVYQLGSRYGRGKALTGTV